MHPPFHTHKLLIHPRLAHGFFGREGGVSEGLYASLNCGPGSKDVPAHVVQNRARVAAALGSEAEQLCTLYQIHSPEVITVTEPFGDERPQADAMVTNITGITLGILTADCGPILFADVEAGVIGAAHAGWKGAHGDVVENTVMAMEKLGAKRERIVAVLGPCIQQLSYEVGPEFIARFAAEDQAQFFISSDKPDHHRFDLPGFILQQLTRAGLQNCANLAMDTCSNPAQFFSYRRTTLLGEPDYGREISAITLRK